MFRRKASQTIQGMQYQENFLLESPRLGRGQRYEIRYISSFSSPHHALSTIHNTCQPRVLSHFFPSCATLNTQFWFSMGFLDASKSVRTISFTSESKSTLRFHPSSFSAFAGSPRSRLAGFRLSATSRPGYEVRVNVLDFSRTEVLLVYLDEDPAGCLVVALLGCTRSSPSTLIVNAKAVTPYRSGLT